MMLCCRLGNFGENVEWLNFLSLACSALDNVSVVVVMY